MAIQVHDLDLVLHGCKRTESKYIKPFKITNCFGKTKIISYFEGEITLGEGNGNYKKAFNQAKSLPTADTIQLLDLVLILLLLRLSLFPFYILM